MTTHLENESSHLRYLGRLLLETLQEVLGEDEVSLLPSGKQLVALLPEEPLLDCAAINIKHIVSRVV